MLNPITPKTLARPLARYSHAVEVPPGSRLIACSGQLGIAPDGTVPPTAEAQAEICFQNIAAILEEGGMRLSDIVRVNAYVTGYEHRAGFMAARDRYVADPPPASTLVVVVGLSRPELFVEVEVIAAREAE